MYTLDNRVAGLLMDARGDMSKTSNRYERFTVFDTYVTHLQEMDAENDALAKSGRYDQAWYEVFTAIHQVWSVLWEMYMGVVKP